jgi:hypothetical protein
MLHAQTKARFRLEPVGVQLTPRWAAAWMPGYALEPTPLRQLTLGNGQSSFTSSQRSCRFTTPESGTSRAVSTSSRYSGLIDNTLPASPIFIGHISREWRSIRSPRGCGSFTVGTLASAVNPPRLCGPVISWVGAPTEKKSRTCRSGCLKGVW